MENSGDFWTVFIYFGRILFSYLLPPLITVQTQQFVRTLWSWASWETILITILYGGPVHCTIYSIFASPDPFFTLYFALNFGRLNFVDWLLVRFSEWEVLADRRMDGNRVSVFTLCLFPAETQTNSGCSSRTQDCSYSNAVLSYSSLGLLSPLPWYLWYQVALLLIWHFIISC